MLNLYQPFPTSGFPSLPLARNGVDHDSPDPSKSWQHNGTVTVAATGALSCYHISLF